MPKTCRRCMNLDERDICMNPDSPCCGQWIQDIDFYCSLIDTDEEEEESTQKSRFLIENWPFKE